MNRFLSKLLASCNTSSRRCSVRPNLECLETRELLAADFFSTYLPNTAVANLARSDYDAHGSINYNDMLGIYSLIEKSGAVSSSEATSLASLSAYASSVRTPANVSYLEAQVIGNNLANRLYEGYSLGDLKVGSSANQLTLLVDKWFLGTDQPLVAGDLGLVSTPQYGVLFASGGPSYVDVHQGGAGDCGLMAALAVTAAKDPAVITNMFIYNGNDTWTVRFYENGSPVYVTVNNDLVTYPSSSQYHGEVYYDQPVNGVLWAALAEKAYAELNAFDPQDGYTAALQYTNEYTTATGGISSGAVLSTLTDQTGYTGAGSTGVAQALNSGALVTLGTGQNTGSAYIVENHEYAVIGYNATTRLYTLFNPWGVKGGAYNNVTAYGTFTVNASYLETYFTAGIGYVTAANSEQVAGPQTVLTSATPAFAGLTDARSAGLFLTQAATENAAAAPATQTPTAVSDAAFSAFDSRTMSSSVHPGVQAAVAEVQHAEQQEAASGTSDELFAQGDLAGWWKI